MMHCFLNLNSRSPQRYVNVSNYVLWFTYTKAFINTVIARISNKTMTFKVTEKKQTDVPAAELTPLVAVPTPPMKK